MKNICASLKQKNSENGNILIIILLAVFLIGALTFAIQGTLNTTATIDKETLLLRATDVKNYGSELQRGVQYILNNGVSEEDIRFSHPNAHADYGDLSADTNPEDQLFHKNGGGVTYQSAPAGINDGSKWEFYGSSHLPEVGSDAADLIAVLPNVTAAFCTQINKNIGFDINTIPQDTGACLYDGATSRFDQTTHFDNSPNSVNEATFSIKPALQGCVYCNGAGGGYHYYMVLLAR